MNEEPIQRSVRASDADRNAAVGRLETALAEGRISTEEFERRAERTRAAVTIAELEPVLTDLPQRGQMVGSRAPETMFDFFANIRLGDGTPLPRRIGAVLGDVRLDLRHVRTDTELIELNLWSVLGDVEVIVAEGVDAQLDGWTLLGKHRTDLAPMPRLADTPRVSVRAHSILGDLRLRSLAPDEPATRWRSRLRRLAQRPRPPVPPVARREPGLASSATADEERSR